MTVAIVLLLVVVVAASFYFGYKRNQQIKAEFAAYASSNNLQYSPANVWDDIIGGATFRFGSSALRIAGNVDQQESEAHLSDASTPVQCFELLNRGDGREVENNVWGNVDGVPMRFFDYRYYEETTTTDSEGNTTTSRDWSNFACGLVNIGGRWPSITVSPEGFFGRMGDGVGFDDIRFESEEFNKAFNVSAKDKRFASALIDPRMMQWLLDTRSSKATVSIAGCWMLVTQQKSLRAFDIPALAGTAKAFREHVPAVVGEFYPETKG